MTVRGRFSLDTNILIYAVDADAGDRHDRSKEPLARAVRRDCVLTIQSLAELHHATTRKKLLLARTASVLVQDWLDTFQIVSADGASLLEAIGAVEEHRLSFWDAMIPATARRAGCTALVTEDMQDSRRLGGAEFVTPFATDRPARLATLLGA